MIFDVGGTYARADVKEAAGLPRTAKGGDWDTGIVEHSGEFVIFANVGTKGRTGHDYTNEWVGDQLQWQHKAGSHLGWQSVQRLLEPGRRIHVFWRAANDSPFKYAGLAGASEVGDTTPVEVLWPFGADNTGNAWIKTPEESEVATYTEGRTKTVLVNVYERDRRARQHCLDVHGTSCQVCGLSFEARYGQLGAGFIHVHHLVPIAGIGTAYQLNPVDDLRPVCPNCHAMLHRTQPPLTIEELRARLREFE